MNTHPRPTLYSLQIGRAVAAIAVVVHHSIFNAQALSHDVSFDWFHLFKLGYLGVDYFFVLSGFIITHVSMASNTNAAGAKYYALSRFIRIYVPYIPATLAMLAMLALMDNTRSDYSLLASLTLLPSHSLPVLSVAWTLQHELVFYALFGLCAFVFKRPSLIFLWALPIVGLLFFDITQRWGQTLAGLINLEFLFGVGACYAYHSGRFKAQRHALLLIGIALVGIACYVLHGAAVIYQYRIIAGLGFSVIVLAVALYECTCDFSRFRTLIFLGAASYAIYLVHAPFMSLLIRLPIMYPHWAVPFILFIPLSCVAGAAYFMLVERPLLRLTQKRLLHK